MGAGLKAAALRVETPISMPFRLLSVLKFPLGAVIVPQISCVYLCVYNYVFQNLVIRTYLLNSWTLTLNFSEMESLTTYDSRH